MSGSEHATHKFQWQAKYSNGQERIGNFMFRYDYKLNVGTEREPIEITDSNQIAEIIGKRHAGDEFKDEATISEACKLIL